MITIIKKIAYLFLLGVFFNSCIEPADIKGDYYEKALVVEGRITTDLGPHTIRITESARYGSIFDGVIEPVTTAQVTIRDSEGRSNLLTHTGFGLYNTEADFAGEVGKGYIIEKSGEIDSIYPLYKEIPFLSEGGILNYRTGVDIYGKYKKSDDAAKYYYWDYQSAFFIKTYPELFTVATRSGRVSAPKSCCSECYRTESESDGAISAFPVGSNATDAKLFFIEDNGYRFFSKYVMTIKRYSISREAFLFYDLIRQQQEINGEIFDPPPAALRGNILNIDDLDEIVVGYFLASDVQEKKVTINRSDLKTITTLPVFADNCLELSRTSTSAPALWNE
jgi:hypothetical protein